MRDIVDLLGRIFLSAIFIFEAYDTIAFPGKTRRIMLEYGLDWNTNLFLYGSMFVLTLGAILLLIGYRSTFGALLLFCFWVPVTFIVHDFWNSSAAELRLQSIFFMKNMAIAGGLLMVVANGSGKYSIKRLLATTRV